MDVAAYVAKRDADTAKIVPHPKHFVLKGIDTDQAEADEYVNG